MGRLKRGRGLLERGLFHKSNHKDIDDNSAVSFVAEFDTVLIPNHIEINMQIF